jgi:hypothetical protein
MAGENQAEQASDENQVQSISDLLHDHYDMLSKLADEAFEYAFREKTQGSNQADIPKDALDSLEFAINYAIQGTGLIHNGHGGSVFLYQSFDMVAKYVDIMHEFHGKKIDLSKRNELMKRAQYISDALIAGNEHDYISNEIDTRGLNLDDAVKKVRDIRTKLSYGAPENAEFVSK